MRKLIQKAVSYAKRNPDKTKNYARKASSMVSKRKSSSRKTPPK